MFGVDLQTESVARLIQLALGPVFLLSGVGITLSMLTARLARIVDRARTLEVRREGEHGCRCGITVWRLHCSHGTGSGRDRVTRRG